MGSSIDITECKDENASDRATAALSNILNALSILPHLWRLPQRMTTLGSGIFLTPPAIPGDSEMCGYAGREPTYHRWIRKIDETSYVCHGVHVQRVIWICSIHGYGPDSISPTTTSVPTVGGLKP